MVEQLIRSRFFVRSSTSNILLFISQQSYICNTRYGYGAPPSACRIMAILNTRRLTPLDTQSIITELEAERDRLNSAIAALHGGQRRRGRPAGKINNGRKRHL